MFKTLYVVPINKIICCLLKKKLYVVFFIFKFVFVYFKEKPLNVNKVNNFVLQLPKPFSFFC